MMNKDIYILVGPAAHGKSTYADKLLKNSFSNHPNCNAYLCADDIREELYGDPTIQGNGKEVFGILFDRYIMRLKDDTTSQIIIDNTSLTYKIRKRYYILAEDIVPMFGHSFKYTLVFFKPNYERALEWDSKRERHVPPDVIKRHCEQYQGPTEFEEQTCNIIRISQ